MSAEEAVRRGIQQALELPSYEPTPPTTFNDSFTKTWDQNPDSLKLSMIKGEAAMDVVVAQMIYDCKEDWIDRDKRRILSTQLKCDETYAAIQRKMLGESASGQEHYVKCLSGMMINAGERQVFMEWFEEVMRPLFQAAIQELR